MPLPIEQADLQNIAVARVLAGGGQVLESVILGDSMAATLPAGSQIRIECGRPAEWRLGEILAFSRGGKLVGHRLVYVGRGRACGSLLLRGDARLWADPPVPEAAVVGRVTAVRRQGGWESPPAPTVDRAMRRAFRTLVFRLERTALQLHPALPHWIGAITHRVRTLLQPAR